MFNVLSICTLYVIFMLCLCSCVCVMFVSLFTLENFKNYYENNNTFMASMKYKLCTNVMETYFINM